MKKFFGIFIILSTFAMPAISDEFVTPANKDEIVTRAMLAMTDEYKNSSETVQSLYPMSDFCDSEGYVERDRYRYLPSLGEISKNCRATPASITISCYKYKKIDNIEEKITREFSDSCGGGKKVNVIINKNLTRPATHLSQEKLCSKTNGEWKNNKCTCNPKDGIYYKYDKLSGCSIKDEIRTKQESKKAEQKAKTEQQKKEKEDKKAEQKAKKEQQKKEKEDKKAEQKAKKEQQKKEKEAAQKQLASDCATAGGKIIAGKCKCNDNKKIYDPDTKSCISKTANYDAAINILNKINSALDETMTKLSKKTQEEK